MTFLFCRPLILLFICSLFDSLAINANSIRPNKEFVKEKFQGFIQKYNKQYSNEEEKEQRFDIFEKNLLKIELLNKYERGTAVYGVTQFADLTIDEFKKLATGFRPELDTNDTKFMTKVDVPNNNVLPDQFDWRQHSGVVSSVKNQGMCGSCWAFSATGNIEGQWAIAKGQAISLSEQELVDCDKIDQGCSGGLPTNAYKTVIEIGGIETENDYPYDGRNEKCHFNRSLSRVQIDSYVVFPENETFLAQWLANYGPISIGINANAMQFYFGGISHPYKWMCSPSELDHGVLIVGYGIGKTRILKKTLPFWTIKNSWGKGWGEQGYYRVYRGDGTCGVNKMATSAWINK